MRKIRNYFKTLRRIFLSWKYATIKEVMPVFSLVLIFSLIANKFNLEETVLILGETFIAVVLGEILASFILALFLKNKK